MIHILCGLGFFLAGFGFVDRLKAQSHSHGTGLAGNVSLSPASQTPSSGSGRWEVPKIGDPNIVP